MKQSPRRSGHAPAVDSASAEAAAAVTTTRATHASPASPAGSFFDAPQFGRPAVNRRPAKQESTKMEIVNATRPIDVYQASERTSAATETTGKSRAQNPAQAGKAGGCRGRNARVTRACGGSGSIVPHRVRRSRFCRVVLNGGQQGNRAV